MADENLSGVPPVVTLSGLQGVPSFSGAGQGAPGGGISGAQPGLTPGIEGGPDLLTLLLQQAGQGSAGDVGVGGLTPFSAQALGQQQGGIGAGAFGQGGGQGLIAGGMGAGAGAQQATGAGAVDPLSILMKLTGLASKVAGQFSQTASPTMGDSGVSTSDQLRSQQAAEGGNAQLNGITASPVNLGPQGVIDPVTGLPQAGTQVQPTVGSDGVPITGFGETGAGTGSPLSMLNQTGPGGVAQGTANQEMIQSLLQAGFDPDQIQQVFSGMQGVQGFGAGEIPTGGSIESGVASPVAGAAGGLSGAGLASAGFGGLSGLLGALQGFKSGTGAGAVEGAQGLASAAQALNAIATGTEAGSAAIAASPALEAISGAISAAAAPAAVVAPFIQALVAYLGENERIQAGESGYVNNPIRGALNSAATAGVGRDLSLLQTLQGAPGGLSGLTTQQEESALTPLLNNLLPYYQTAPSPLGEVRASDTVTAKSAPPGAAAAYTEKFNQAQQGTLGVLQDLLNRGVSYQELGKLPVSNAFSDSTRDMANPLNDLYAAGQGKYDAAAQPLLQNALQGLRADYQYGTENPATGYFLPNGMQVTPGQLNPQMLFQAAQGAVPYGAPDKATNAGGLTSAMYGGPLWEAIARMGAGGPQMQSMIQQNFNPWAVLQGFSPEQLQTSLLPMISQGIYNPAAAGGAVGLATGDAAAGDAGGGIG